MLAQCCANHETASVEDISIDHVSYLSWWPVSTLHIPCFLRFSRAHSHLSTIMQLLCLGVLALFSQAAAAVPRPGGPPGGSKPSSKPEAVFQQLQKTYTKNVLAAAKGPQCNKNNIAVRRSW